jgi:hypothetical protein
MATKAQRHKAKKLDNRLAFRGSGFKGDPCWKLLSIVIKILNTRLHPLGENALKKRPRPNPFDKSWSDVFQPGTLNLSTYIGVLVAKMG